LITARTSQKKIKVLNYLPGKSCLHLFSAGRDRDYILSAGSVCTASSQVFAEKYKNHPLEHQTFKRWYYHAEMRWLDSWKRTEQQN